MVNRRVAILTSGGDSPSMNATVYSFLVAAELENFSVYGVIDGYKGLIGGNFKELKSQEFQSNFYKAGTFIGSSRCLEFQNSQSAREKGVRNLKNLNIEALFVIGGDGSYKGANLIKNLDFPVVTAPGTIDNDVASTGYTIGFFSALEEIFQAIKRVKATSDSHSQITFLEVMGRDCSDLSVCAAIAGNADLVITNKNPLNQDELVDILKSMIAAGKRGIVIVVSEKIYGEKFSFNLPELSELCEYLESKLNRQVRASILGYVQRGAEPTSWDLYVASGFGRYAFSLIKDKTYNLAVGFDGKNYYGTALLEAINMSKKPLTQDIEFVNSVHKTYTKNS